MKRIIITDRDEKIIEFLNIFKVATTSTIATIFFNGSKRPCSRRLKYLREHGFIKSSQEFICLEQIHYINKKPTQLKHNTIISNFIGKLHSENINILKLKKEFKIDSVRCDLLVVCEVDKKVQIYMVEVCNTKPFDLDKYIKLKRYGNWDKTFPVFPTIISISNKPVKTSKEINIIKYNLELKKE